MTDLLGVEPSLPARSSDRRLLTAVVGGLLLVVAAGALAVYIRVGWSRMESACEQDGPGRIHDSVSYAWSWQPLGFRCTYGNGDTRTSLWP